MVKIIIRLIQLGLALKVAFIGFATWGFFMNSPVFEGVSWAKAKKTPKRAKVASSQKLFDIDSLDVNQKVKLILKARLREVERKEQSLKQEERDLKLLKTEIEKRISELKALQASLNGPMARTEKQTQERFSHLVGVYSSMEPQRAALLLEKMDENTVVRLFSSMKSKKVAKILSFMDPDKAARISGKLSKPGTF